jgi:tRNA-uridine 2-sulfurtransferase
MSKVSVGLSGGVDSAVAALLLKQQGHEVSGIYMQNWEVDNDDPYCSAEQDLSDAKAAADHIGIPFETVNFSKEYWDNVFQHCLDEFSAGRTPNPDVLCNREIKFKALLDYALEQGADYLATGHYANISNVNDEYQLLCGNDDTKDQSYFLYMLNQHALKHAKFPLGELEKTEVRKIAESAGLPNYNKKDSTGICFIGERKFSTFLNEFLLHQPGDIKTVDGKTVGKHNGLMFYTLGQRKGLEIGGLKDASEQAWYVVKKDLENNLLIIGQGHDHPLLYSPHLTGDQLHWHSMARPTVPFYCQAKTRYHQAKYDCHIAQLDNLQFRVTFDEPLRAITPGQSVVFYQNNICLGGGIIANNSN